MKKRWITIFLAGLTAVCMAGCGDTQDAESSRERSRASEEEDDEEETEDEETDDKESTETADADASIDPAIAEQLRGRWEFVYMDSTYEYNGQTDRYFEMAEDMQATELEIVVTQEADGLYVDYESIEYDQTYSVYHLPLQLVEGPLYEGCENTEWHVEAKHPVKEDVSIAFTLVGDNELMEYVSGQYDYEDGPEYYQTERLFLKEGSEQYANASEYRYFNTVEVTTVDELLAAVDDNTRIILNAGEYDFSDVKDRTDTDKLEFDPYDYSPDEVVFRNVNHLKLEAKEGAEVEICIDDIYAPVLEFQDSSFIFLEGLTCGHHVEPGHCSGSVIRAEGSNNIFISGCSLYGCGTYGIECVDVFWLQCDDTEIHDCNYGIVSLYDTYTALFNGCSMHDNEHLDMIDIYGGGNVCFTDCDFENNTVNYETYHCYFVKADNGAYSISFTDCNFKDNVCGEWTNNDRITVENCNFDDVPVG